MTFTKTRLAAAAIMLAAICMAAPQQTKAQVPEAQMDGVMGQSIKDETGSQVVRTPAVTYRAPALLGATYSTAFQDASFTTDGDYTNVTYYHNNDYADAELINGIDVSYWQADAAIKKKYTSDKTKWNQTGLNWESIHDAGIDFTFVRVASRDTKDGSIYRDNCADSHIQGALDNDINVGLYIFSQALNETEAQEEAEYVLDMIDEYGWDITMPIVMDREPGANKRLTAGKLSKAKETAICQAFADTIADAGYRATVYASYSWIKNYIDTDALSDCSIWIARYNNTTTNNSKSGTPYADITYDYEFWQYSSTAKVDGYTGSLDADFWYKDTSIKTTGLTVNSATASSVNLKWNKAADDVTGYRVYRYDDAQGKFVYLKATKGTTYSDTAIQDGVTYRYKVRCYWTIGGNNYYGTYSAEVSSTTPPAKVTGLGTKEKGSSYFTISWNAAEGAGGYRLYMRDTDEGEFEQVADITDGSTSYKVSDLDPATEYQFKVEAYETAGGTSVSGTASAEYADCTNPDQVESLTVQAGGTSEIQLTWDEADGVSGYQVYRLNKKTGKYELCATIKSAKTTSYRNTGLAAGTEYAYKVRAYKVYNGKNCYGSYSDVKKAVTTKAVTKPAKVKSLKASSKASAVTLTWGKVSKAGGYQVYRYDTKTKKYVKIATVKGETKVSYKNTRLTKGTTYKYKVRAYKTVNGKTYYGAYSTVVTIKAK